VSQLFLRRLGIAGTVAVLLLVANDMRIHAGRLKAAEDAPVDFGPEGFRQTLGGVGMIETAVRGRVRMLAESPVEGEDGRTTFESRFQVEGDDPRPLGEGMELKDAVIDTLQGQSFTVTAPTAWIPMAEERSRLRFDLGQLWQLRSPEFMMADFHDGHALTIATADADLDPATNQVFGRGPFTLDSDTLHLEGSDLYFDPARSRVEFQPLDGVIRWSIRGRNGELYEGVSDGPGAFSPAGEDGKGFLLELHADESVRSTFPEASRMPGILDTQDLELHLVGDEQGEWRLDHAVADGPTDWTGQRLTMNGGDTIVRWREDGDGLDSLEVGGKVHVVPVDESFHWAEAEERAIVDAATEALRLEGDIAALHPRGILLGDWAELGDTRWEIGGRVFALGEDGMASAERLHTDRQGDWWIEGDAELRPNDADIDWVRSPRIRFTEDGLVETNAGFELAAVVDGLPLHGQGRRLLSLPEPAWGVDGRSARRTEAEGELFLTHGPRTLRGDQLVQTGPESLRITGLPGLPVHGTHREGEHEIALEAGRVEWRSDRATLEEDPVLRVPAALLELQGEVAEVRAERFVQEAGTGAWSLLGGVEFRGALTGGADEGRWIPDESIHLWRAGRLVRGKRETASLAGTRLNGTAWSTKALDLRLDAAGTLTLDQEAHARIQLAGDSAPSEVWGRRITWREASGEVKGEARFSGPQGDGSAKLLTWRQLEGQEAHLFTLEGEASLVQGEVQAQGDRLSLDTSTATMTAIGAGDQPARLRAADGRTAVGEWLRYNLDSGAFDARGARFESP
jgi:hypothetical protein